MNRLFLMFCLCASVFSPSAGALEITYSNLNPFSGNVNEAEGLFLTGEIVPGDYSYLLDVIRSDTDRFWRSAGFVLASTGGDVQEAMRIARLVKGTYSSVFVGKAVGPCISACFFIFSAAAHRDAGSRTLGIHRPYVHPRRLVSVGAVEAEVLQRNALRQARSYLEDLNVPTSLIDKMFSRASTEVYWLSREEIDEQLGRRPPWYEQFLIARCGFSKELERKYFSANDNATLDRNAILDQLMSVNSCGARLSAPEAKSFLASELKKKSAGR